MLRRLLRGSSRRSSKDKQNEENKKPKNNLPRTTEVQPCEWPCEEFLRVARIYDDFYYLAENAGLIDFLHDQREQYLLLTNIFVQNFYFHARKSPPSVEFYLYDEFKEMSLHDFCRVRKIPFVGSIEEPHRSDVDGFIDRIYVGETRKVSDARITSIHFPVLRYFAIFAGRCLIGRGNSGNLSTPDLVILCHALFRDTTFNLCAIIAKRLSLNHTKGPVFGGIFAYRLAEDFEIPIRHHEKEEKLLPPIFLDYKSMVAHEFIVKNKKMMLKYNLIFNKTHCETVIFPAPSLFNILSGTYLILPEAVYAYWSLTPAPEPEPEPSLDPYRQFVYQWDPEEIANQWHPDDTPPHTEDGHFDPWA